MAKYQAIPVEVEAIKYDGSNKSRQEIARFVEGELRVIGRAQNLILKTAYGNHTLEPGGYVARGVDGELFTLSEDLFPLYFEPTPPFPPAE